MKVRFTLLGLWLIPSIEAGMSCCKNAAGLGPMLPDPYAVKPAGWDEDDDGKVIRNYMNWHDRKSDGASCG